MKSASLLMVRQVRAVDSDCMEECGSSIVSSSTSGMINEEVEVTVNASVGRIRVERNLFTCRG